MKRKLTFLALSAMLLALCSFAQAQQSTKFPRMLFLAFFMPPLSISSPRRGGRGWLRSWTSMAGAAGFVELAPKERSTGPCQEIVWEGADVDLGRLPVQTCWPGDVGALIT